MWQLIYVASAKENTKKIINYITLGCFRRDTVQPSFEAVLTAAHYNYSHLSSYIFINQLACTTHTYKFVNFNS